MYCNTCLKYVTTLPSTLAGPIAQWLASADSKTGYALLGATAFVRLLLLLSLPSQVSQIAIIYYSFCYANCFVALWSLIASFMRFYFNVVLTAINFYVLNIFAPIYLLIRFPVINDSV